MNSQPELDRRVALGTITWTGPLLVLVGRSFFMIAAQGMVAAGYALRGHSSAWNAAAPWWSVWGTLVDIGCLTLMMKFTRAEGITLRDLIGKIRLRWGRDLFLGIGCFLILLVIFTSSGMLSQKVLFGSLDAIPFEGLHSGRRLPVWAVIYSLSIWWLIWSPTEELTYNGYVLPRMQALAGRKWIAVLVVGFWWALQHSFIPLILDWKYVLWHFVAFVPGVLVMTCMYLWFRRLSPLILAHWLMDIAGQFYTLSF